LPRLIEDLEKLERTGYPEAKCRTLTNALREIIKIIDEAAGSMWQPCMSTELHEFLSIYEKWNDCKEGADLVDRMQRRQRIDEMRKVRHRMSNNVNGLLIKIEKDRQLAISGSVDVTLAEAIYSKLATLTNEYPETFPILNTAIEGFTINNTK